MGAVTPSPSTTILSKKFVVGVKKMAELWGGPVRCVLPPSAGSVANLEDHPYTRDELPFELVIADFQSGAYRKAVEDAAVVSGCEHHRLHWMARFCKRRGIAFVPVFENALPNRLRMILVEEPLSFRRARRIAWTVQDGLKDYVNAWQSTAIQCNGTPAYKQYRWLSRDALLFFDSRATTNMVPTDSEVRARVWARPAGEPIRLGFSGRFIKIKGADHLPVLAAQLRERGVAFELHLYGAGPLEAAMRQAARDRGVEAHLVWHGAVDFATKLLPELRKGVDLFVACHRQADPAGTYIETLSCGVPIAGYGNEAFRGVLSHANCGWLAPIDNVDALTAIISRIANDRTELERASLAAVNFGRAHTFERTFAARIEHYRRAAAMVCESSNTASLRF